MKITVKRPGDNFELEATNEEGHTLLMDSSAAHGGSGKGMRPMQLLLSALGGCSAIDIIGILKKQRQPIAAFEIEVEGTREKTGDYSLFRQIHLHIKIRGNVEKEKAERAVNLSLEKYCSVAKTLEPTAQLSYTITISDL